MKEHTLLDTATALLFPRVESESGRNSQREALWSGFQTESRDVLQTPPHKKKPTSSLKSSRPFRESEQRGQRTIRLQASSSDACFF
jgi:hypothetical protein